MRCLDENVLSAHLARELAPDEAAQVTAHIDECAACADLVVDLARLYPGPPLAHTPMTQRNSLPVKGPVARPPSDAAIAENLAEKKPHLIGRYIILDAVGAGGMGVVYSAYDPKLDRKVAVKLMRRRSPSEDASRGAQQLLIREAQTMARVSDPNVLVVHDVGSHDGHVYFVVDFIDGWTLRGWLHVEKREPSEIVTAVVHAGRGLSAAHKVGLVHCDFKPDNVLISREGRVVVSDFGLTRTEPSAGVLRDLSSTGAGTPAYMAPEVANGGDADARSDQYSFCVTLFEALFGRRPNSVDAQNLSPAMLAAVPEQVRMALVRGLSVDPDARFPNMEALLAALSPFATESIPGRITPSKDSHGSRPSVAVAVDVVLPSPSPPDQRAANQRRRGVMLAVVTAAALMLVGLIALGTWRLIVGASSPPIKMAAAATEGNAPPSVQTVASPGTVVLPPNDGTTTTAAAASAPLGAVPSAPTATTAAASLASTKADGTSSGRRRPHSSSPITLPPRQAPGAEGEHNDNPRSKDPLWRRY